MNFDDCHENLLQFFENSFDGSIVTETNRHMDPHFRGETQHTNLNEMRVFLIFTIVQSMGEKSEYRHYWTKNRLIPKPFFAQCMAGKGFEIVKQYLYFSINEESDETTHPAPKPNKIWLVYDNLMTKFYRNLCTPK